MGDLDTEWRRYLEHLERLEDRRRRLRRSTTVWVGLATVANLVGWTMALLGGPWWLIPVHAVVTVVLTWLWYVHVREGRRGTPRKPEHW